MELSRHLFSPLREGDLTFYRSSGNGHAPVLLVVAEEDPGREPLDSRFDPPLGVTRFLRAAIPPPGLIPLCICQSSPRPRGTRLRRCRLSWAQLPRRL